MTGLNNKLKIILLIGIDILLLYFSLWLALYLRFLEKPTPDFWQDHLTPFSIVFLFWLIIFYIDGWYDIKTTKNKLEFYSTLFRDAAINTFLAVTIFYLTKDRLTHIKPQTILLLNIIIFTMLFGSWRQIFNFFAQTKKIANNTLIIGLNQQAIELAKVINQKPHLGFHLVGIIDKQQQLDLSDNLKIKLFFGFENLKEIVTINKVNTIITALDPHQNPTIVKELFACLPLKVNFFNLANFYESISGKIPVTTIQQTWFLENLNEQEKKIYEIAKRLTDIFLSLIIGLISLPLLPFIAIIIKSDSPGSVLFKQKRVGKDGKIFLAVKFRTMIMGAEKTGPQWAQKNDKRVTKVGNFLRKTRLDEIPQLFNVIKGEMSLIGPRPERPEFVQLLQQKIPFYRERLLIKPGLTGWAQVNFPYGASVEDAMEKLQYDLYYLKHRSLILDLDILLRTVKIMLSREGR